MTDRAPHDTPRTERAGGELAGHHFIGALAGCRWAARTVAPKPFFDHLERGFIADRLAAVVAERDAAVAKVAAVEALSIGPTPRWTP